MCGSSGMRVATVTTRTTSSCAPYIGALLTNVSASVFSSFFPHGTLPVLNLCLSAFAPLLFSLLVFLRCFSLCSAHLVSPLLCNLLCSALLVSGLPRFSRSLFALDFHICLFITVYLNYIYKILIIQYLYYLQIKFYFILYSYLKHVLYKGMCHFKSGLRRTYAIFTRLNLSRAESSNFEQIRLVCFHAY